jgi:hypothetical protein
MLKGTHDMPPASPECAQRFEAAARQENFTRAADKSQDALEVSKQHLDAFAHAACRRRGNHCVSAQFN